MASVQQSSLRTEQKNKTVASDEMNKNEQEVKDAQNAQSQDIITSYIYNQTLGLSLELLHYNVWFGSVVGTYPPTIKRGVTNAITSRGSPPGDAAGSKVAVIYGGSNIEDATTNNCAWLLAWYAPADGKTASKVYVEAGDISKYSDKIKWDDIEMKLDASSNESYYMDDDTASGASASLVEESRRTVKAVFDIANTSKI